MYLYVDLTEHKHDKNIATIATSSDSNKSVHLSSLTKLCSK